jgi:hypothetical protein
MPHCSGSFVSSRRRRTFDCARDERTTLKRAHSGDVVDAFLQHPQELPEVLGLFEFA